MYDSLTTWQDAINLKSCGYLQKVPTLLNNVQLHQKENGTNYYTGNIDNLMISVAETGISIKGSINKFWHKNNFKKITRQETKHSFEKLQDLLHIPLLDAKLTRIDIANNMLMKQKPNDYYAYLGVCNHYKRFIQPNSVYYKNGLRTKLFYDKILEGKSKGEIIPPIWQGQNILRYELRYMSRIAKQLKKPILVSDLYDEQIYINFTDAYLIEYEQIVKNRLFEPKNDSMTCKDAKEYLLSALIEQIGFNEAVIIAENWKENFSTSKEAQRFKRELNNLKGMTQESPLMLELDEKINRISENYR